MASSLPEMGQHCRDDRNDEVMTNYGSDDDDGYNQLFAEILMQEQENVSIGRSGTTLRSDYDDMEMSQG